jgi:hypothetical protein
MCSDLLTDDGLVGRHADRQDAGVTALRELLEKGWLDQ